MGSMIDLLSDIMSRTKNKMGNRHSPILTELVFWWTVSYKVVMGDFVYIKKHIKVSDEDKGKTLWTLVTQTSVYPDIWGKAHLKCING